MSNADSETVSASTFFSISTNVSIFIYHFILNAKIHFFFQIVKKDFQLKSFDSEAEKSTLAVDRLQSLLQKSLTFEV